MRAARSAAELSTFTLIEDGGTAAEAGTELSDRHRNSRNSRDKMAKPSFDVIRKQVYGTGVKPEEVVTQHPL